MPEEFQSVPETPAAPRRARRAPPGCPAASCGGDVVIDGDTFRCVGLDGPSNRLRTKVRLRQSLYVKLLTPTGFAGATEVQAFHERQRESLRSLPKAFPALPACGGTGDVSELANQEWRLSAARCSYDSISESSSAGSRRVVSEDSRSSSSASACLRSCSASTRSSTLPTVTSRYTVTGRT